MNDGLMIGRWYKFRSPKREGLRSLTPRRLDGKFQCHEVDHDNDGWSRDVLFRGETMRRGACFGPIEDVEEVEAP